MTRKRRWHEYLWLASAAYLLLGFFNILFAWLGLICFLAPLLIAAFRGDKSYCGRYCGRGQLLELLGGLGLSRRKAPPRFLRAAWFRYGFPAFFMAMFGLMLLGTWRVFAGAAALREAVTLLWVFRLPWDWADVSFAAPWAAQFAFGFYGVMLTSTVLGLLTMVFYKPRSWCVYCPMGTMTQGICRLKHGKKSLKNVQESGKSL